MLIDTHSHLNFNIFKEDFDEVIQRSLENDVWVINIGTKYETSKKAIEIAQKYEKGVYAAIGLHPIHLETGLVKIKMDPEEITSNAIEEKFDYDKYKELANSEKVVAIGEIGLDYYYKPKTKRKLELFKEKQRLGLCQQLELARELNLPVIFHCRMAHQDLIKTLTQYQNSTNYTMVENVLIKGVIHCFTGNLEQAEKYLEMGFYLGLNGIIFKLSLDEIIKRIPLDKILIETDCPYLTPPPMTGRNEPLYLKYIAEKIAKIKNISYEEISRVTTQNAIKLFNLHE